MLAEEWRCSERHVRNLVADGALRHFRLGGKLLRIRREDVEAFEQNISATADDETVSEAQASAPKRERAARLDRPGLAPLRGRRKLE
uniref:helix-turn-helix domain-containing protein n=1 Tax=Ensifer adhaerens TaxID=106592 RepID=UPI003F495094